MIRYKLSFGNEEPGFVGDISQAQAWLMTTIKELGAQGTLEGWRTLALIEQTKNMPNAGMSFLVKGIGLIKAEKERV